MCSERGSLLNTQGATASPQSESYFTSPLGSGKKSKTASALPSRMCRWWISSSVRLVTHASYPPSRGTLFSVDEARHYLFTSGYLPELGTYPGPHIPIPVELTVQVIRRSRRSARPRLMRSGSGD